MSRTIVRLIVVGVLIGVICAIVAPHLSYMQQFAIVFGTLFINSIGEKFA